MTLNSLQKAVLIFLLAVATNAQAGIYRWIDEQGNVRFSDAVPPKASKLERHLLDKQGNLRDVLKRQRTLEELELHRKRLDALATEKERRGEQEKYDRYLWTTFSSIQQLEELRDDRLHERDGQIAQLQSEIDDLQRAIVRQEVRQGNSAVAQQNLLRALQDDMLGLEKKRDEMNSLRQREFQGLNKDMARYEYLRLKRAMNSTGN